MKICNRYLAIFLSLFFSSNLFAKAIIDLDVLEKLQTTKTMQARELEDEPISIIVFLHDFSEKHAFIKAIKKLPNVEIQNLNEAEDSLNSAPYKKKDYLVEGV